MSAYALSGTIAPRGVYILANPAAPAGVTAIANAQSSFFNFDGTDALALLHLTDTIDIIGQLHVSPGASGWATTGGGSTVQHTLIRNYYNYAGRYQLDKRAQTWNAYPADMIDSLGFHNAAACGSGAPVATVRFVSSGDSVPQVLQFIHSLLLK